MHIKVFKGQITLADVLIERTSYMLDEISENVHKDRGSDWKRKMK